MKLRLLLDNRKQLINPLRLGTRLLGYLLRLNRDLVVVAEQI